MRNISSDDENVCSPDPVLLADALHMFALDENVITSPPYV